MFKRKRNRRKVISILMIFLMVSSWLVQPAYALDLGSGGKEVSSTNELQVSNIEQKSGNIAGKLTQKGVALGGVTFSLQSTSNQDFWFDTTSNTDGTFQFELPDGQYKLAGIWLESEKKWYPLDRVIEVSGGVLVGNSSFDIDLPKVEISSKVTLTGSIVKGNEVLSNIPFSIHTTGENPVWYDLTTSENGSFSVELPTGEYQINGVWVETEKHWYEMNKVITVAADMNFTIDLEDLLPPDQQIISGTLTKQGQELTGIGFSIHTANDVWYSVTTDSSGNFKFVDLPDGEYFLDGIWVDSDQQWYQLDKTFSISNGELVGSAQLNISIDLNVTGAVTIDDGPVVGDYVSVHPVGNEDIYYNVKTNENGQFGLVLPDGDYQINGFWLTSLEKWFPLNRTFRIVDGNLSGESELNIQLRSFTAKGSLSKGADILTNVTINAHTLSGEEMWYDATTDENGIFKLNVPDGDYQIDGIWVPEESKWYSLNTQFTVSEGKLSNPDALIINIEKIEAIIPGNILKSNQPLSDIWVSAHTLGENETWYNAKSDENGAFSFALPDGEYKIDGVWIPKEKKWYSLQLQFSIQNGEMVDANGFWIDLSQPFGNVNGAVTKANNPLSGVWVSAHTTTGEELWFDTKTNEAGMFSLDVPDGNYQIDGIWIQAEQKWYPQVTTFSVENGVLINSTGLSINLTEPILVNNINGKLQNGNSPISGVSISTHTVGAEEKWYSVQTNTSGEFGYNLPDGNYRIEGVWVNSEQTWYPLSLSYSVVNGKLVGMEKLQINLQDEHQYNVSGTLVHEATRVGNAHISIENLETSYFYDAFTDANGNFRISLEDGLYNVYYVWASDLLDGQTVYIQKSFNVMNGQIYIDGSIAASLDLKVTPESLILKLSKGGTDVNVSEVYLHSKENGSGYTAYNDGSGIYVSRLPDGLYTIDGYFDQNYNYVQVNKEFSVVNGTTNPSPLLIQVEKDNVTGEILVEGNPGSNASFTINEMNTQDSFWAYTDENGHFSKALPNGYYTINQIWSEQTGYALVDIPFSVVNGKVEVDGVETASLSITIPNEALTVQILKDGLPLVGEVSIQHGSGGATMSTSVTTDENGMIHVRAVDGIYKITSIYHSNQFYYNLNEEIEVMNGTTNPSPYLIDVFSPLENVQGVIKDSKGSLPGAYFYLQKNTEQLYVGTDTNGAFALNLQDGSYKINEVYYNGDHFRLDISFEVQSGKMYVNGSEVHQLPVTIPNVNFIGIVKDDIGVIPWASIEIKEMEQAGYLSIFSSTDQFGKLSERLIDGNYEILSAYVDSNKVPLKIPFAIQNGKLLVNGVEKSFLDINLPPINIQGKLIDSNGTVISNSHLNVYKTNSNGSSESLYVTTDQNGEFKLRYPKGEYLIRSYYDPTTYKEFLIKKSFSISDDGLLYVNGQLQSHLIIQAPGESLHGQLLNKGNVLSNANITIWEQTSATSWQSIPNISTDSNGYFVGRLPDGIYQIHDILVNGIGVLGTPITFEITNGVCSKDFSALDIGVVHGNVIGKVVDGASSIAFADLSITDVEDYHGFNVSTNEDGEFGLDLPDGQYRVTYINASEYQGQLDVPFSVENGLLKLNGGDADILTVNLPAITVTGNLTDGNSPIAYTQIGVKGMYAFINLTQTDVNGNFSFRLPDGDYWVVDYSNSESNGLLKVPFSVENGQLVLEGTVGNSLNLTIPEVNASGTVFKENQPFGNLTLYYELNEGSQFYNQYRTEVDEDGNFSLRLPDGDYKIVEVYSSLYGQFPVKQTRFSIENGQLLVEGNVAASINVNVISNSINGTLVNGGERVANTSISFRNMANDEWIGSTTNQNGEFALRLTDGNYRVDSIWSPSLGNIRMFDEFSVQNGNLIVNGVEQETLSLSVPEETLFGVIKENGVELPSVILQIEGINFNEFYFDAEVNQNGEFAAPIPDGEFAITSVISGDSRIPIYVPFIMVNGELVVDGNPTDLLNVDFSTGTVPGNLKEFGELQSEGYISFTRYINGSQTNWFDTQTDENGNFTLRLPDGEYKVISAFFNGKYQFLNTSFEVISGKIFMNGNVVSLLSITSPEKIFTGRVMNGDTPVPNASIGLVPAGIEYRSGGEWKIADENGNFQFQLPDGTYYLYAAGDYEYNILNNIITIEDGVLMMDGIPSETLDILYPEGIFQGKVVKDQTIVKYGNMRLKDLKTGMSHWIDIKNGEFNIHAADGEYVVETVTNYYDDKVYEINVPITIKNGTTNPSDYVIQLP